MGPGAVFFATRSDASAEQGMGKLMKLSVFAAATRDDVLTLEADDDHTSNYDWIYVARVAVIRIS